MYRIITFCDVTFQILPLAISVQCRGPTTPATPCDATGLGCSPFARHYWGNHCYFLFLQVLRCFSSLRMPPLGGCRLHGGLSHSEIFGSMAICASPKLIAAYHVLHRCQEPRHPPYALSYFLPPFTRHGNLFPLRGGPAGRHT